MCNQDGQYTQIRSTQHQSKYNKNRFSVQLYSRYNYTYKSRRITSAAADGPHFGPSILEHAAAPPIGLLSTNYSNCYSPVHCPHIRFSTPEDISTVSGLMATAFTEDLQLCRRVQNSLVATIFGAGLMLCLYQSASRHEKALQLGDHLHQCSRQHGLLLSASGEGHIHIL